MHLTGKYKISWSNDVFYKSGNFVSPHESIMLQGAMADRVKKMWGKQSSYLQFQQF